MIVLKSTASGHSMFRRVQNILLPILLLLAVSGLAAASGGEGGHEEFPSIFSTAMLWRVINFAVLFGFLYKVTAGPVRNFMSTRSGQIQSALEQAKRSKEDAEARYKEITGRLAGRDQEFEEIRRTAVANAEKLKERIMEEAHEKVNKIEEKARESIRQEIKKAKESLKQEAVDLALKLSEERLLKEISSSDHKRFVASYLNEMKG